MNVGDEIRKAQQARRLHIANGFTNSDQLKADDAESNLAKSVEVDIKKAVDEVEEAEIEKAVEVVEEIEENPFEKAISEDDTQGAPADEVEKSDILYAMNDGGIKFSKTGKEIKDQINTGVLPALNADLAVQTAAANTLLEDCGAAPTKDVSPWWTQDMKLSVPFKVYDWEDTYLKENCGAVAESLSVTDAQSKPNCCPASKAEADTRRKYNDTVGKICNIMTDIKACELLQEIKDTSSYELSPRQVITFGFVK